MKYLLIITIFMSSYSSFGDSVSKRRTKILQVIDQELSEVKRLSSQQRVKDPDLILRMAELNLEKARLWKEKENADYLKLSDSRRRKINKKSFFKKSASYYSTANRLCLNIVRNYKRYPRIGDVYYILGFNAKEVNKQKIASKYLGLANKKSKNKETQVKSKISLAEVLYNQKQYRKAIPLYESALSRHKDKWWTKDSFNLAWCYFRSAKYTKALDKMEEIFRESSKKQYIDMRTQVERDVGLFYATSDEIERGIRFYKKIGINFTDQLLRIAVNLTAQGKYTRAEKVLQHALKYEKNKRKKMAVYLEMLTLYQKYNKSNQYLSTARNLYAGFKKGLLTKNQITSIRFQLGKKAAYLQRQVISKTYRRLKKLREKKAKQAIEYFHILSELIPEKNYEYEFLKGETAYAAKLYNPAYPGYKTAFLISEKKGRAKFKKKSMDGMLAVLARGTLKNSKERIFVFEAYLRNWKSGKRSIEIYKRLFKNYADAKKYNKAKNVLDRFAKIYPLDYKNQEAMIAVLMEVSRKEKNYEQIRLWIRDIDSGKYKISRRYKKKLQELLTSIQIKGIEEKNAKGNKKDALIGYHNILKDPNATSRSKKIAMYNLAVFYYELGNQDKSYLWAKKSLNEMSAKEATDFSDSFVSISNFLFTSLDFKRSADLSKDYLIKICKLQTPRKNIAFMNATFTYLSEHDTKAAAEMIRLGSKCRVSSSNLNQTRFELMKEYKSQAKWPQYESLIHKLSRLNTYKYKIIDECIFAENVHRKYNNKQKINIFSKLKWKLYNQAKKAKKLSSLSQFSLNHFAGNSLGEMNRIVGRIDLIKLNFPEKVFNKRLQDKLALLTKLTESAKRVQNVGSGRGIINSFEILYRSHIKLSTDIERFSPPGKSKEYITSFKKQMTGLALKIKETGLSYKSEGRKNIQQNEIFHSDNFMFQEAITNISVPVQHFGAERSLLMDRGGKL